MKKYKVVVIGGGTGTFTVLSALRNFDKSKSLELSAIVSMADDGGSTGVLRDELGVLPPGDIRQSLVALSNSGQLMRDLMNYRFDNGGFKGHNFGNLLLGALEKVTGSFATAVSKVQEILRCEGNIIPVTLSSVTLEAKLKNGSTIVGQRNVFLADLVELDYLHLTPSSKANKDALKAIKQADMVIIGPGEFYTSIMPNLLVSGIAKALSSTKAKKVLICNLMKRKLHTMDFGIEEFALEIEKYMKGKLDFVIYNNVTPQKSLINNYALEGEYVVATKLAKNNNVKHIKFVGGDLLNKNIPKRKAGDPIVRSLIRHDQKKLAKIIFGILK